MTTVDADVLIVGAGCAGLSLAVHLVESGYTGEVVLVDPRTTFGADRTWCFFDVVPHLFESAVEHRWSRWEVRAAGARVERRADGIRYCRLPSERFYAAARARLEGRARFLLGEHVETLVDEGDVVVARTSGGTVVRARRAFDSRPPARGSSDGHVRLLQHFVGHEVETDVDAFDPDVVTLMDFETDQSHGLGFVYVLPFGRRRALVESTFFTPAVADDGVYERAIDAALRARTGGAGWRELSRERGVIPMTSAPFDPRPSARVYTIGLAGGLAKPSTGYAFLAIQRFSAELALRLTRGEAAPPAPRASRSTILDTVFLSFLSRHPESAPRVFTDLFDRTDPRALVRFLSDAGTPADDLRVIAAVRDPRLAVEMARTHRLWRPRLRGPRPRAS